ncbi:SCO family protein [Nitrosomonas sp. PY1]|nr:SCO family protein [Nitrosomonas sp. PY1]
MKIITLSMLLGLIDLVSTTIQASTVDAQTENRLERARTYFGDDLLIDQHGASHRFVSDLLSHHVVLINVIFTNCRDACPIQTQKMQVVRRQLGKHFGTQIAFLSLSVDPKRDSPVALKAFAEKQQANIPGWWFLTADEVTMTKILSRLNQWTGNPSNHSTMLIAGHARNAHWIKLRPDSPPERIVADLLRLAGE